MLNELISRYPMLAEIQPDIESAANIMYDTYLNGNKLLLCGNGGSCAYCDHIVGELMKGFNIERPMDSKELEHLLENGIDINILKKLQKAIPAISLPSQASVISAYANDVDPALVYAQLVYGYGVKGDLFIGISTSGNSENVVNAAKIAKAMGLKTLALTGAKESMLSSLCDCALRVPEHKTFKIQELHLPIYHYLCAELEKRAFV